MGRISDGVRNANSVMVVIGNQEIRPYILATIFVLECAVYIHHDCNRFLAGLAEKQAELQFKVKSLQRSE